MLTQTLVESNIVYEFRSAVEELKQAEIARSIAHLDDLPLVEKRIDYAKARIDHLHRLAKDHNVNAVVQVVIASMK